MWKKVAALLLSFSLSSSFAGRGESHLRQLNTDFPYGLLTDDFGILDRDDLKINSCIAVPGPFADSLNQGYGYPYWQCFEAKKAKMICEGQKYDPETKSRKSMLVISAARGDELHEFISRRPINLRSCRLYQSEWQKLVSHEKYICVSGETPSRKKESRKTVWIFGRYKTKKGCDSYFEGECNLQYQIKQGTCHKD